MLDRLTARAGRAWWCWLRSPADPLKYGRIILGQGDRIAKMVEYKDATEEERAVRLCNSGMMAVRAVDLFRWLGKVGNDNAAGEYYLPGHRQHRRRGGARGGSDSRAILMRPRASTAAPSSPISSSNGSAGAASRCSTKARP